MSREQAQAEFYQMAYDSAKGQTEAERKREEIYVEVAKKAAAFFDIEGTVKRFVADFEVSDKRVLDVGSGRGYLQDMVPDYTGLDISQSAARFYHKKFVHGSATAMPFKDNEFDAIWSIWVLEHIPNPEAALSEMRRVLKPGGVMLLYPAWNCDEWAAQGYKVRPYSDFGPYGKAVKASLVVRDSPAVRVASLLSVRSLRLLAFQLSGPTRLRYRRLEPNYKEYWMPDSDAVNSLDSVEAAAWFESRGDQCLNCLSGLQRIVQSVGPLRIRVKTGSTLQRAALR